MKNICITWVTVAVFWLIVPYCALAQTKHVFKEDFENISPTDNLPVGWKDTARKEFDNKSKWALYRGGYASTYCMQWSTDFIGIAPWNILTTAEIISGKGLAVSFDYNNVGGFLAVYVSFDGGKTLEEEPLCNLTATTDGWEHAVVALPVSATGKLTLCFAAGNGDAQNPETNKDVKVLLDNVVVDKAPRCAGIESIRFARITHNEADVIWDFSNMGYQSDSIEVILMLNGEVVRSYAVNIGGMRRINVNGLLPNTTYSIKLRTNCDADYLGKAEWSKEMFFQTMCEPHFPIKNNFNDWRNVSSCWQTIRDDGKIPGLSVSDAFDINGIGRSIEVMAGNHDQDVFVYTEPIDHEANDLEISFWLYNNGMVNGNFEVGIQTDIKSAGTYAKLKDIVAESGKWINVVAYTKDTPLKDVKNAVIAVVAKGMTTNWYIDNLSVNSIPPCARPENVIVTGITDKSMTFDWKMYQDSELEVWDGEDILLGKVSALNKTIVGNITSDTEYNLKFKASCGSPWSFDEIKVRTACNPLNLPLSESFEHTSVPQCWLNEGEKRNGTVQKWNVSTVRYNSGGKSVTLNGYPPILNEVGENINSATLVVPYINIPDDGDSYIVRFYMYRKQPLIKPAILNVYAGKAPFVKYDTRIFTISSALENGDQADGWYKLEAEIPVGIRGDIYVIFEGVSGGGDALFIDDVAVMKKPYCYEPEGLVLTNDITPTSAKIAWTPVTVPLSWEVEYSYAGLAEPVKEIISGDKSEYMINGLTENTLYNVEFSVKALCLNGDASISTTGIFEFRTDCEIIDVTENPYTEDFKSDKYTCWTISAPIGAMPFVNSWTNGLNIPKGIPNKDSVLIVMPQFGYESVSDYQLSFELSISANTVLEIGVMTDADTPRSFEVLKTVKGPETGWGSTTSAVGMHDVLFDYNGDKKYIAFRFYWTYSNAVQSNLNNILLQKLPPCPNVSLDFEVVTEREASVSVVCSEKIQNFDIEYGKSGFVRGEGISLRKLPAQFELTGLVPNTEYDVYVRSLCDDGEGLWNVFTFTTLCEPFTVTEDNMFYDGFEEGLHCWSAVTLSGTGEWKLNINAADAAAKRDSASMSLVQNSEGCLFYPVRLEHGKKYQFELDIRPCKDGIIDISYCSGNDTVSIGSDRFDRNVTIWEPYIHKVYSIVPVEDVSYIRIKVNTPQTASVLFSLDNVTIKESACEYIDITKVVADTITDKSALISWVSVGADSYQLKVSDKEIDPIIDETVPLKNVDGDNTKMVKVDGLLSKTLYYVYIRSVCGDGETVQYGNWTIEPFMFRTGCETKQFPFIENFDDADVMDCWSIGGDGTGGMIRSTDYKFTGDASARITVGINDVVFITSPALQVEDDRLDNKMLSFRAYTLNKDVNLMVLAGKGDDVYEVETDLTLTKDDGWKEFTVYFTELADEKANKAKNISVVATINAGGSFYIDDFSVNNLSACPKPVGIEVSDIETDNVELTWNMVDASALCNIKLTSPNDEEKIFTDCKSPYKITELKAQTYYTAEISVLCSDGESDVAVISFTTGCGLASFPFKENFNNMLQGELSECWIDDVITGSSDVNNRWSIGKEPINGTNSLMFESTINWVGNTCMVQTPVIDLTDVDKAYLSFRMSAPGNARMDVLVSTDGAETFDMVLQEGIVSPEWNTFVYELDEDIVGKRISIGFRGVSNRGRYNLYVDDIEVVAQADCPKPAGITVSSVFADSVELTVNSITGDEWHVAVLETGTEFNEDYTGYVTFDTKPGIICDLHPTTRYEVYVRNVCGMNRYSRWLGPVCFETQCGVQPVGYKEDFESYESKTDLKCILGIGSNGIGNFPSNTEYDITDDTSIAIDGKSLKMTNTFTAGGVWLVLPKIDEDIEKLQLSYAVRTSLDNKEVVVYLLSEDNMKWDPSAGKVVERNIHAKGVSEGVAYFDGTALIGKDYRIAVWTDKLVTMVGNTEVFAIDNICVDYIPSFFIPHGIELYDISHQSALVRWIKSESAVASQIMINGDTDNLIDIKDNTDSHLFNNLVADTRYTLQIRDICGVKKGDTTEWSSPFVFTTNKMPATVPYNCNFENDKENENWLFSGNGESVSWCVSERDPQGKGVYDGEKSMYIAEYGMHTYSFGLSNKRMMYAKRSFYLTEGAYSVEFTYHSDGHMSYTGDADYLKLVLVPAGKSPEDLEAIDISGALKGQSDWTEFNGYFSSTADGYYDLIFVWNCDVVGFGMTKQIPGAVDDIVISEAECVPVLDLSIDSVRAGSALVTWTNKNMDDHTIEYVLQSGDEEFDEIQADILTAVNDCIRLTDLEADKAYSIFIRMVCEENYTDWVSMSFSTPCKPVVVDVDNFVIDDFEDYNGEKLGCWHHADNTTARWTAAAPDVIPFSGDKDIVIRGNSDALIYRQLEMTAGFNYQVLFYAKQSQSQNTGTSVDVLLGGEFDNADEFRSVGYAQPVTKNEWTLFTYRFSVKEDGVYSIGLKGTAMGKTHYLAIDSVVIRAVACDQPVNLQAMITSGFEQIFWSGGTAPFDVTITSNGIDVDHELINAPYFMIKDLIGAQLPSATRYTVSVRSICAEDRISDAAELTFVTSCNGVVSVPYFEDFELSGTLPSCWQTEKTNGVLYPWSVFDESNGNSVVKFESSNNPTGASDRLFSPEIHVGEKGWSLNIDYLNPAGGALSVYLSKDGGVTYCEILLDEVVEIGIWQTLSVSLDNYVGENVMLIAKGVSNYSLSDGAYIYLDNFRVSKVSQHKVLRDTACYETAYIDNGFELPVGILKHGDNILTRLAYGVDAMSDTLYTVNVFVPNSDFYITDMFIESEKPYDRNGFEGVVSAEYELTRTVKSESCGCDSTIHLTLIPMVVNVEVYDTICESDLPYVFCKEGEFVELTESDTYTCTVKNSYDKDSVTVLHLTVLPSVVERFDTICDGGFVEFGGRKCTVDGIYETDSIYASGCEYKSVLYLNVVQLEVMKDTAVCQGQYVEIEGERYGTTGKYVIPLTPVGDCSREMILNLTVTSADTVTNYTHACEGKPIYDTGFAGKIVSHDTVLYRIDKSLSGCDSITKLVVDFIPTKHAYDTVKTNEKYYLYNGRTLTVTGDYKEELQSDDEYSCDSIHHLYIEFEENVGIDMINLKELIVVPNPMIAGNTVYVDGDWTAEDMKVGLILEIMDATGRVVYCGKVTECPMPIDGLSVSGVYIIRIKYENGTVRTARLMVR